MKLNVNGFEPNSNVGWKVVHPETQAIPTYGYFSTNNTGGFSESAYIESESQLAEGKYEIQFFDMLITMVMQIKAIENLLYLCLFHVKNSKFKTYKEFKLILT